MCIMFLSAWMFLYENVIDRKKDASLTCWDEAFLKKVNSGFSTVYKHAGYEDCKISCRFWFGKHF